MTVKAAASNISLVEIENFYSALGPAKQKRLDHYLAMITKANMELNLTGFKHSDFLHKIIFESSIFSLKYPTTNFSSMLDLGSGAGIPGIVLAIVQPECKVYSLDKSVRKIQFQESVKSELMLNNLEPICLDITKASPELEVDAILIRAFKPIPEIFSIVERNFKSGISIFLWKGQNWPAEYQACLPEIKEKFILKCSIRYDISEKTGGSLLEFSY